MYPLRDLDTIIVSACLRLSCLLSFSLPLPLLTLHSNLDPPLPLLTLLILTPGSLPRPPWGRDRTSTTSQAGSSTTGAHRCSSDSSSDSSSYSSSHSYSLSFFDVFSFHYSLFSLSLSFFCHSIFLSFIYSLSSSLLIPFPSLSSCHHYFLSTFSLP